MSDPAQKCENNAIIKQIYALKLFIAFKMAYSCCFGLRGHLDFPDFLQNNIYNINCWCSTLKNFLVINVIKLFWRKSRFPSQVKQQEWAILKAKDS